MTDKRVSNLTCGSEDNFSTFTEAYVLKFEPLLLGLKGPFICIKWFFVESLCPTDTQCKYNCLVVAVSKKKRRFFNFFSHWSYFKFGYKVIRPTYTQTIICINFNYHHDHKFQQKLMQIKLKLLFYLVLHKLFTIEEAMLTLWTPSTLTPLIPGPSSEQDWTPFFASKLNFYQMYWKLLQFILNTKFHKMSNN